MRARIAKAILAVVFVTFGWTGNASAQPEPFVGQIMWVGFNFCPRGWTPAEGQLLAISSHTALFSLYGTAYGGDGRTTFGLPDLRGRVSLHMGQGPGLTNRPIGSKGGTETVTLTANQMPAHNHTITAQAERATQKQPTNAYLAKSGSYRPNGTPVTLNAASVSTAGASAAHTNMPPFTTMRACVALVGVYPSRN